jgi:hypothetical protein
MTEIVTNSETEEKFGLAQLAHIINKEFAPTVAATFEHDRLTLTVGRKEIRIGSNFTITGKTIMRLDSSKA